MIVYKFNKATEIEDLQKAGISARLMFSALNYVTVDHVVKDTNNEIKADMVEIEVNEDGGMRPYLKEDAIYGVVDLVCEEEVTTMFELAVAKGYMKVKDV